MEQCFTAWFQKQEEFNSTIKGMAPQQLNKCLQKFICRQEGRDETFYNKKIAYRYSCIALREFFV